MSDRLFGFRECQGPRDVRFWLDHGRCHLARHLFIMETANARRRRQSFEGFVRVIERLELETHCQVYELVYKQSHDIWCTGVGLCCGAHGSNCPANDAVQYWLSSGHKMQIHHPFVTVDGRIFMAGACMVDGYEAFQERFE